MKTKNNKNRIDLSHYYPNVYFTMREAECVYLLISYETRKTIGKMLGISSRTVDYYLENVRRKIDCKTQRSLYIAMEKINYKKIYKDFFDMST